MSGAHSRQEEGDPEGLERRVSRSFTCTTCGYANTLEATPLQAQARATCLHCGEWTVQFADGRTLIDASRDAAATLSGTVLTERQALAFLLREVLNVDRQHSAKVLDCTPSNVDNLHRRAREKLDDAQRVLCELDRLSTATDSVRGG